ncbi:winged helix-turn-helix transcriptional regulator [Belliella filtrata]|uniref:winged helix-turn-helix transcriptional regulator n=1 Tax=Belliella filtrata TaxID=2923435 RepID=UPI00374C9CBB
MKEFLHNNRIYYNPIEFAMAHIGGTWKIPILLCLRNGSVRYGDLKKAIPHISDKMLYTHFG